MLWLSCAIIVLTLRAHFLRARRMPTLKLVLVLQWQDAVAVAYESPLLKLEASDE
jgi:hypothetical protein